MDIEVRPSFPYSPFTFERKGREETVRPENRRFIMVTLQRRHRKVFFFNTCTTVDLFCCASEILEMNLPYNICKKCESNKVSYHIELLVWME